MFNIDSEEFDVQHRFLKNQCSVLPYGIATFEINFELIGFKWKLIKTLLE